MNDYPFAGPGGQKTLHRQAAESQSSTQEELAAARRSLYAINVLADGRTPHQVYSQVMNYDNR